MSVVRRSLVCVLLLVACSRRAREQEVKVQRDPIATSATDDSGVTAEPPVDFGSPGLVVISPKVPPFVFGMMDHAQAFGWSKDGRVFGLSQLSVGYGATACELYTRDGKLDEYFDDVDAAKAGTDPKKTKANEARIKALGLNVAAVPWRFARDVELTWTIVKGDAMATPPRPGVLRVGARVHGEPISWVIALSERSTGYHEEIHPEAIALSPDGEVLGVIAHAFGGEFSDRMLVELSPAARLASHAYNDAGYAHHAKGDYVASADFFRKAIAADGTHALSRYNLACAYARLGDPRAEKALREAISFGVGDEVKKRARDDADFAGVRATSWFVTLVGA